MKIASGNTHRPGISKTLKKKMEKYAKQRRYREKQKEKNEENAAIVAYVKNKYPWIIREFFEKDKVRVISIKLILPS